MDNQPAADEWDNTEDDSADSSEDAVASLAQLAGALTRVAQQQSHAEELGRNLAQIRDTLTEAIVAFSSLAKSTVETEGRLQAAAEKLEATVERLLVREQNVLRELDAHVQRFTTLLLWTMILASFAAAASSVAILFFLFKSR